MIHLLDFINVINQITSSKMSIFKATTMNEYSQLLKDLKDIDYVYISVGGKVNELIVKRFCYSNMKNIRHYSNSTNHLIPNFLKYRQHKSLIISLDNYKNEESYLFNHNIISQNIDENMNFIIFDMFCTIPIMNEFLMITLDFVRFSSIVPDHFMICNYIKFMNEPNLLESKSEIEIPETIHLFLQKEDNSMYSHCFYNWFGYNYYTYNLIYNYNSCRNMNNLSQLVPIFKKSIKTIFTFNDDFEIIDIFKNYKFWNHIIDITSFIQNTDKMSLSLYEQYEQLFLPSRKEI